MSSQDPDFWRNVVLSPMAQALAIMGGLGGFVRAVILREDWRETVRVISVGCIAGFCTGPISPYLLKSAYPDLDLPRNAELAFGILGACTFLVGIVAIAFFERLIAQTNYRGKDE